MASTSEAASEEEKLAAIDYELQLVEAQLQSLKERKESLLRKKQQLKDNVTLKKSLSLANRNWCSKDFPWSKELVEKLKSSFKISEFRPFQLQTINATLSKEDVILIMPTGGGKSLCYQLPAVILPGITLVVCPLVALMEDQLYALKSLGINASMLSANASREEVNAIQQGMVDKNAKLKLLYVTPEKLAKSKRFMTKLQKMYEMKRLSLIAIDEVHCCSQWGHDFRPDYKFLGVLKAMFPDVPVLGLTATATSKVIVDVQKMLNITGCLVFKASFNRPNLFYEVRPKPSNQKECFDVLTELLKTKYAGKSGIIYTTSIKDCEELMQELRTRGMRIGCYHANLDASVRSKVHMKWLSGEYQAVVATIAFGMGIDKPDVRFVIHHSLSKSMENFYQESGRAGRDNKPSDCVLFYRFADVFKLSTMVFTQQTGLENLYGIVAYCMDKTRCRRSIIATHFDEAWESSDCNGMCDHCSKPYSPKEVDIVAYCCSLFKIISHAAGCDVKLTAQMLIDSWFGKGKANLRVSGVKPPTFSKEVAEDIVGYLLINGYLQEDFHFTPYSTISYMKRGPRAAIALAEKANIFMITRGTRLLQSEARNSPVKISTSPNTENMNSRKNDKIVKKDNSSVSRNSKLSSKERKVSQVEIVNIVDSGDSNSIKDEDEEDFQPRKKKKIVICDSSDE